MSEVARDLAVTGLDGLDGLDGYPHRWFGGFPVRPIAQDQISDAGPETFAASFAASLAELALTVKREGVANEQHALTVITEGAVAIIDGAEYSAVVVPDGPGRLAARSVHGDLPPLVMALQNDVGEGPCLEAVAQTLQVVVGDVSTETRWPQFTAQASRCGVGSMLCTPLAVQDRILGSLSLVSTRPNAFDEESAGLAAVFAAHATLALVGVHEARNLKAMASSRDLIGQAKGILMERHKLTAQDAFSTLVRSSQNNNIKLRDLCQRLTDTGELPS